MEQPSPIETHVLQQLLGVMKTGALKLVDEEGQPLGLLTALDHRCWAHLTDAQDGKVYVHELPGSRDLAQVRYLDLLGINV